jgi:hypothetical protein
MAKIGYARVSSVDQDFNGQIERLRAAGCDQVFSEKASGKSTNGRHALDKAIRVLRPGDTLVTVRLDRLARSIRDLLNLVDTIEKAGAHIKALDDHWLDTTTAHGELILTVMGGWPSSSASSSVSAATRGSSGPRPGAPCSAASPCLMPAIGGRLPSGMPRAKRWRSWPVSMSAVWPPSGVCCTDDDLWGPPVVVYFPVVAP